MLNSLAEMMKNQGTYKPVLGCKRLTEGLKESPRISRDEKQSTVINRELQSMNNEPLLSKN